MRISAVVFFAILPGACSLFAEVAPVDVSAPKEEAWIGEKVSVYVELRAKGSFSGSASFDLPETPGSLLIKVGNPVVGSREIEGENWFTQRHEFALFSQKTGAVEIPPFPVRFQARDDFTGPVRDIVAKTEAISVAIKRPPGSEGIPFLVTTAEFTVEESWDPVPGGTAKVGDVFRRSIVQRAVNLTGMALLPSSTEALEGIRVYPPRVETKDNTERGAFDGERRETLTYLLQEEGVIILPELTYTWWNPKAETLQSKTLPAITLEVFPAPVEVSPVAKSPLRTLVPWIAVIGLVTVLFRLRHRMVAGLSQLHRVIDPPDRAAARKLRRACRRNDADAAQQAWSRWLRSVGREVETSDRLRAALAEMQRVTFGPGTVGDWNGAELLEAFREQCSLRKSRQPNLDPSALPSLNSPRLPTRPS